jgi:hypothetical protein
LSVITNGGARGEIANHCRPDGSGGFICTLERVGPAQPPPLTPELIDSLVGFMTRVREGTLVVAIVGAAVAFGVVASGAIL